MRLWGCRFIYIHACTYTRDIATWSAKLWYNMTWMCKEYEWSLRPGWQPTGLTCEIKQCSNLLSNAIWRTFLGMLYKNYYSADSKKAITRSTKLDCVWNFNGIETFNVYLHLVNIVRISCFSLRWENLEQFRFKNRFKNDLLGDAGERATCIYR